MPKGARTEGGWGTVLPPPSMDSTHAARIAKTAIKNSNRRQNGTACHTNQRHPTALLLATRRAEAAAAPVYKVLVYTYFY